MKTETKTVSTTRTVVIGCQIRTLMKRLSAENDAFIEEVVACVLDGAAKKITFCAMNGDECMAKLSVEVDWEKHGLIVSQSGDKVDVADGTVLIETSEVIRAMLNFVKGTDWNLTVIYTSPASRTDELRSRLNLHPCTMPEVEGASHETNLNPYELEELTYRMVMKG